MITIPIKERVLFLYPIIIERFKKAIAMVKPKGGEDENESM
jgi:hypothetical protein